MTPALKAYTDSRRRTQRKLALRYIKAVGDAAAAFRWIAAHIKRRPSCPACGFFTPCQPCNERMARIDRELQESRHGR